MDDNNDNGCALLMVAVGALCFVGGWIAKSVCSKKKTSKAKLEEAPKVEPETPKVESEEKPEEAPKVESEKKIRVVVLAEEANTPAPKVESEEETEVEEETEEETEVEEEAPKTKPSKGKPSKAKSEAKTLKDLKDL